MKKKGVSTIIASVLLVFAAVVLVGFLFFGLMPSVQDWLDELSRERVPLSIEVNDGYTVWDADRKMAKVQIFRGAGEVNISKIKVIFVVYGTSLDPSVIFPPEENQVFTKEFDLAGYDRPERVDLVPIIMVDGEEIELDIISMADLKDGVFEATYVLDVGEDETKQNPGIFLDGLVAYYPLTNDLVNYLSFNGSTKQYDEVGEFFGNASTDGRFLHLDGDGDYVSFPQENLIYGEGHRTACIWAKTSSLSNDHAWAFSYGSPGNSKALFIGRKGVDLIVGGFSASDTFKSGDFWLINKWTNVCARYNTTNLEIFLNGQNMVLTEIDGEWNTQQNYAYFGRNNNEGQSWAGSISDFTLYERPLSNEEIFELFLAQKNRYVEFQD